MDGKSLFNNRINTIVASTYGDVNGDYVPDLVYLTGRRTPDSEFIQDIKLFVRDGKTGITQSSRLKSDAGYNPTLFLGDFTGKRVNEIMVGIASGGSGGIMFYYIFSDLRNQLELSFDYEEFNQAYQYKVDYQNNYKVQVLNIQFNSKYIIDISTRDKEYLDEIYTPDGTLKAPIEGWVDPLSGLYPVDFDANGVYELLGYQGISGRYHTDSLGYVQSILKWNKNTFKLDRQYVAVFGT